MPRVSAKKRSCARKVGGTVAGPIHPSPIPIPPNKSGKLDANHVAQVANIRKAVFFVFRYSVFCQITVRLLILMILQIILEKYNIKKNGANGGASTSEPPKSTPKSTVIDDAISKIQTILGDDMTDLRENLNAINNKYNDLLKKFEELIEQAGVFQQEGDLEFMNQIIAEQDEFVVQMNTTVLDPLINKLRELSDDDATYKTFVTDSINKFKTELTIYNDNVFTELVNLFEYDLANEIQKKHVKNMAKDLQTAVNNKHMQFKEVYIEYYKLLENYIDYPGDGNEETLDEFRQKYDAFAKALTENDTKMFNVVESMMNDLGKHTKKGGSLSSSRKPKVVSRNPMQYYMKKYVQSGGDPKNGRAVRTYVNDLLTKNIKLGERVMAYGKARGLR